MVSVSARARKQRKSKYEAQWQMSAVPNVEPASNAIQNSKPNLRNGSKIFTIFLCRFDPMKTYCKIDCILENI